MKSILYIVDCFPDESNSVADILANTLSFFKGKYNQTVAKREGYSYVAAEKTMIDGIPCYCAKDLGKERNLRIRQGILYYFLFKIAVKMTPKRYRDSLYQRDSIRYWKELLRREKPDLVVWFCLSPEKKVVDFCIKYHIPYCCALYDTYLKRPEITPDCAMEEYVIRHSVNYLIPSFFYPDYEAHYHADQICPYDLPLLISKEQVARARKAERCGYPFVYFGQLQAFRNANEVEEIFRTLGYSLDVFTGDSIPERDVWHKHNPIKGDEMYAVIAHSNFLVALDNNVPYENYLPSKAYLYVSFGKPILVFGNNEQSAIRAFLKDYPCWYYQTIGEPLDGLMDFIERYRDYDCDTVDTAPYRQYLPENSLNNIYQQVLKGCTEREISLQL